MLIGMALVLWVSMRWPCVFRAMTGLPCPGCGLSRAWLSALHLDFYGAFSYHPMFWGIPVMALIWLFSGSKIPRWGVIAVIAIAMLYFVCYIIRLVQFHNGVLPI